MLPEYLARLCGSLPPCVLDRRKLPRGGGGGGGGDPASTTTTLPLADRVFGRLPASPPPVASTEAPAGNKAGYSAATTSAARGGPTAAGGKRSLYRRIHNGFKQFLMERVCQPWANTCTPITVMELGMGQGGDLFKWARLGVRMNFFSRLTLWGTDVSTEALQQAWHRAVCNAPAVWPHLDLRLTATDLADVARARRDWWRHVDSRSVDVVACHHALHYMCGTPEALTTLLQEVFRVLKPGGAFIVTAMRDVELYALATAAAAGGPGGGAGLGPGIWVQRGGVPPPQVPAGTHSALVLDPPVGQAAAGGPGQGYWYALVDHDSTAAHYFGGGGASSDAAAPRGAPKWSREWVVDVGDLDARWRQLGGRALEEFPVGTWWDCLSPWQRQHFVGGALAKLVAPLDPAVQASLHLYAGLVLRKADGPVNIRPVTFFLPDRVLAALEAQHKEDRRRRLVAAAKSKGKGKKDGADDHGDNLDEGPLVVFQGTMPMSLDVTNVTNIFQLDDLHGFSFNMTLKLDGERQWVRFGADGAVWTINRAQTRRQLAAQWPPAPALEALLDVEVMRRPDGREFLFVFDAMEVFDASLGRLRPLWQEPWWRRREALEAWFAQLPTHVVGDTTVQLKQFYHVADMLALGAQGAVEDVIQQHRVYGEEDGWIFTAVQRPYSALPLKWKPTAQQTIDVVLARVLPDTVSATVPLAMTQMVAQNSHLTKMLAGGHTRWCQLMVKAAGAGGAGRPLHMWMHPFVVTGLPAEVVAEMDAALAGVPVRRVLELSWDAQLAVWKAHRIRTDRTEPNALRTVDHVWSLIQAPLMWERLQLEYAMTIQKVQQAMDAWVRETQLEWSGWLLRAAQSFHRTEGQIELEFRLGHRPAESPAQTVPGFPPHRWKEIIRRWCQDTPRQVSHECVFNGVDAQTGRRVQYRLQTAVPDTGVPSEAALAALTVKTSVAPPTHLQSVQGIDVRVAVSTEHTLAANIALGQAVPAFGSLAASLGVAQDAVRVFVKERYTIEGIHWKVDLTQRSSPGTPGFKVQHEVEIEFTPSAALGSPALITDASLDTCKAELVSLMTQLLCH